MPVSAEVLAAIEQSGLPLEAQACLGALSVGEGGRSFRTLYGDNPSHPNLWSGSLDHFPTIAEWPGGTGPGGQPTSALGFLQFERATYAECVASTGLAGIDHQSQIANGWWLAQHDYAKRSGGGDLLAALQNGRTKEVASALLSTWPGGADTGFPTRYATCLTTLSTSAPTPDPPPSGPVPNPTIAALAGLSSQIDRAAADIRLAVARIVAPTPDIATQINDLEVRLSSELDSLEQALAEGQSAPSFRR